MSFLLVVHDDVTDCMFLLLPSCEDESTVNLNEACRMRGLQAGMMEKLTESIAPALLSRIISSFTTFMVNFSASDTSHRVRDQLFTR